MSSTPIFIDNQHHERLAGVLHGEPGLGAVITCHGLFSHKDTPKHVYLAERLAEQGVAVLRFDFAGCGASAGHLADTSYSRRVGDLDAVLAWLWQRGTRRVGVFGSSVGGSVALLGAARDERIVAVATLGAVAHPARLLERYAEACAEFTRQGFADFPEGRLGAAFYEDSLAHEIAGAVGVLHAPILVLHGLEDQVVPCSDAHDIASAARNASLDLVDGADHGFSRLVHMRPAMMRVATFLADHLG